MTQPSREELLEQLPPDRGAALTKLAAECHRTKWQFDFSDENRLPIGQARDVVRRAFGELHRIGDLALKLRDESAAPPASSGEVREAHTAFDRMLRESVIEVCAKELETSYPDHVWLNAACAAIRALKSSPSVATKD